MLGELAVLCQQHARLKLSSLLQGFSEPLICIVHIQGDIYDHEIPLI